MYLIDILLAFFFKKTTLYSWMPKDIYLHHIPAIIFASACLLYDPIYEAVHDDLTRESNFYYRMVIFTAISGALTGLNEGTYSFQASMSTKPENRGRLIRRFASFS